MALALAKEFTQCSNCEDPLSEVSLYMCIVDQCSKYGEIYCEGCGKIAHKRQNHKFNTGWTGNTKKFDATPMKKGIQKGMNKINGALGSHTEKQQVAIRQGILGSMVSAASSSIYFEQFTTNAMKLTAIATESGGSTLLGTTTDIFKEYAKGGIVEGAGPAALVMGAFETVFQTIRFINGDIETWGEYGYHLAKGWTATGGLCVGNLFGGAIGATVGGICGGPLGAFIGKIIGGILGGLIVSGISRSAFDALFKGDKEQIKRATLIKNALLLFSYASINDLENEYIFNEKELKKRYKNLAKIYHPDMKTGSADGFHTVTASFGCLIALVRKNNKSDAIKMVKKIQAICWD